MYKLGTGDCITIKFFSDKEVTYTMLIDCGCFNIKKSVLTPFINELIKDLGGHVDALVVTHEHQDHVLGFQRCEDLFVNKLTIGELWMGWTEDDENQKVNRWKQEFGQKKMALAIAANLMDKNVRSTEFKNQLENSADSDNLMAFHQNFSANVMDFANLHVDSTEREYVGALKGMAVVKDKLNYSVIAHMSPGEIYSGIDGLDGVNIYVLGPPKSAHQVDKEKGEVGETYRHNKDLDPEEFQLNRMRSELEDCDYFVRTLNSDKNEYEHDALMPFSSDAVTTAKRGANASYNDKSSAWRKIDNEWLESSANLALRMNSLTNNLSLVLAIEFVNTGKVMLFPGDAEFGSWESWHQIDWDENFPGEGVSVEKLLNNTVFYKVAHHLSHNGTAQSLGLEMMTHPDLIAMATLNYDGISSGWKSTMPNRAILKDLLERTNGRLIVQNTDGIFYDMEDQVMLEDKIEEFKLKMTEDEFENFHNSLVDKPRYVEIKLVDI